MHQHLINIVESVVLRTGLYLITSEVKYVRFSEYLNSILISALGSQHFREQATG